ncbi:MAG: hypothetical protein FIB07_17035 [Candidatus Methanoperedens sp.]|nr:hypothetical protein [Candidatus Methanoperedens sp.]
MIGSIDIEKSREMLAKGRICGPGLGLPCYHGTFRGAGGKSKPVIPVSKISQVISLTSNESYMRL